MFLLSSSVAFMVIVLASTTESLDGTSAISAEKSLQTLDKSESLLILMSMHSGPDQLRDWMRRRGLNQTESAALLGFDPTFISQLLSGRRQPGLGNAVKIERVTGISVEAWLSSELDESGSAVAATVGKPSQDKA